MEKEQICIQTCREGEKYSKMVSVLINIDLFYEIHVEDREDLVLECFFWSILKNGSLFTAWSGTTILQLRGMSPGHISLEESVRKQRLKADCIQTSSFRKQGKTTSLSVALSADFSTNQSRRLSLYPGKLDLKVRNLEKTRPWLHCEVNCALETWSFTLILKCVTICQCSWNLLNCIPGYHSCF